MTSAAVDRGTELLDLALAGQMAATSRLISALEAGSEVGLAVRPKVYAAGGRAHVIGVTGAPGSGKSTLVAQLAGELRSRGKTVGIVAVDPSSSLTGGAVLGDRIRMQRHTLDEGVFVRSMSSRGRLGGVSRATIDAVAVLDASGWDVVIVETVGVGQAEVDIVQIAQTTMVVSVPGLGDEVQAIKAGLLEIADLHVVNKADRPDADKTRAELRAMLTLGRSTEPGGWDIPVLPTAAVSGEGVRELTDMLEAHLAWMREAEVLAERERDAAAARVREVARDLVAELLEGPGSGEFDRAVGDVVARRSDPYTAARALLERSMPSQTIGGPR